jgi:hypothetical protein
VHDAIAQPDHLRPRELPVAAPEIRTQPAGTLAEPLVVMLATDFSPYARLGR